MALARERIVLGTDVTAHVRAAEFGVELHAPGRLAPAERVATVLRRTWPARVAPSGARSTLCRCVACAGNCAGRPAEQRIARGMRHAARCRPCPSRDRSGCSRPRRPAHAPAAGGHSRCRTAACPSCAASRSHSALRSLQSRRSVTIAPEPVISTPANPSRAGSALALLRRRPPPPRRAGRPAATRIQCGKRPCRRIEGTGWPVSRIRKGLGKRLGNVAFKSRNLLATDETPVWRPAGRARATVY